MTATPEAQQRTGDPLGARSPRRAGWAVALRIARREVWRAKGRSALVIALVMLPVLVVTALSTLLRTVDVSPVEALPAQVGSADAAVFRPWEGEPGQTVAQCPDLSCATSVEGTRPAVPKLPDVEAIGAVLGPQARVLAFPAQSIDLTVGDRRLSTFVSEVDLTDPMLDGMLWLVDGRAPAEPGEVAVSRAIAERGARLGMQLDLGPYGRATVVGIVGSSRSSEEVIGAPGMLGVPFVSENGSSWYSRWLVDVPGGVTWEQVLALNAHGLTALSRQVVSDPPTQAELAADPRTAMVVGMSTSGTAGGDTLAILGLIAAMILLEVVLLAGPAFAVSASSQTRALGLLAAQGGTRAQLRRVVLAQAVVLGGLAAVAGAVLGLLGTRIAYPLLLDQTPPGQIGPFQVGWLDVAIVAVLGLASAVLAALAPARAASRLDPVRAIAGRRPQARSARWHPVAGVALIGIGMALAGFGALGPDTAQNAGSLLIAGGAVAAVLGAVLLAPLAIRTLARAAGSAPLSPRYAMRDMARNQLRTAPAVAAVTAVVAGAVALSISGSSDAAEGRAKYGLNGPQGNAVIALDRESGRPVEDGTWAALAKQVAGQFPDATTRLVPAAPDPFGYMNVVGPTLVLTASTVLPKTENPIFEPGSPGAAQQSYTSSWWYRSGILVGEDGLTAARPALTDEQYQQARRALAGGAAVVLRNTPGPEQGKATIDLVDAPAPGDDEGPALVKSFTLPALGLKVPGVTVPAAAILPEAFVADTGIDTAVSALVLDGPTDLTPADRERIAQTLATSPALTAAGATGYVQLERGWQNDLRIPLLILGAAAGVLVLAGSLTAALLALSDARPDFATLGAVGAAPRTRRRIAGAYGWAIAFLGAILGAVVGFIPGVAITRSLTSTGHGSHAGMVDLSGLPIAEHYLVIPWPTIAVLVIGLPALVGLLVALLTRSRLPMVARID